MFSPVAALPVPARPIETPRLLLVPATAELIQADLEKDGSLGTLLGGVRVPEDWPPDLVSDVLPYFLNRLTRNPELSGWLLWYWILKEEPRTLIGDGGFGGRPEPDGNLVLGYSVVSAYHGQGYATEAAGTLVDWALEHREVLRVYADVYPNNLPSVRVLQKIGFVLSGTGFEPGSVRYGLGRDERLRVLVGK